MIVTDKYSIKAPSSRILTLSTAYNGFVFVQLCKDFPDIQKFVHVDAKGKRLKQFEYMDALDTFGMFNERQVIVMNVSKSLIDVIDLSTYEIRSYPHQYTFQSTLHMQIHTFHHTKIFCIQQKGTTADHRLILSFYLYDTKEIKFIERFQSSEERNQWNCQFQIGKLNNSGKIGWWKTYQQQIIQFYVYQVHRNEGRPLLIKAQLKMIEDKKIEQKGLNIANMWQITNNSYLLACNITKGKQVEKLNSNFVYDADQGILRYAKFILPDYWNYYLINFYNAGEISVFRTYLFENGQSLQSPVYYVNNERQEIVAETKWRCSNQTQFYVPGFDTSMTIETYRLHGTSNIIQVASIKSITLKQIYMYLLLHLEQDFDDDLLSDAIGLLQ